MKYLIYSSCLKGIAINKIVFRTSPQYLLLAAAAYENGAVRNLIHYFKYNRFLTIRVVFEKILTDYLKTIAMPLDDFIIVPVPLHRNRFRERGFNQSEIIAEIAADYYHLPLGSRVIQRVKDTRSQIELKNYQEREENVKNTFNISPEEKYKIKGKNVLIVDDVYTSGATINEVAKVLQKGGAKKLMALVLAKAS